MNKSDIIKKLQELKDDDRNNVILNNTVPPVIEKILKDTETEDIKLNIKNLKIDQPFNNKDISQQKDIINSQKNWVNILRGDAEIVDKATGEVLDSKKGMKIAEIPKLTDRYTYMMGGNEYQFTNQPRLKPGVYTQRQSNGEISSFFNVDKTVDFDRGYNNDFKINFEPETKLFSLKYSGKKIPLYNTLKLLGTTDDQIKKTLGDEVYSANKSKYDKHFDRDAKKMYQALFGYEPDSSKSIDKIKSEIKDRLENTKLNPDVTEETLGEPISNVNNNAILKASKKIISINRGDVDEDNRESMMFKEVAGIDKHIKERLIKNAKKISGNIKHKINKTKRLSSSISSQIFKPYIEGVVTGSQLSNPPNQTNVMSILGEGQKVTPMGDGGIGSSNAITNKMRFISNSEANFMDPLHTPEGGAIGITKHLSLGTVNLDGELYAPYKTVDGQLKLQTPKDVFKKNVAFPGQYEKTGKGTLKPKSKEIKVVRGDKLDTVPANKVDLIIDNHQNMFDSSTNMIPFLSSIQGNRATTAAKMQEQAVSLKNREKPLFKILTGENKEYDLGEDLGRRIGVPEAPIDGEISEVTPDSITIKGKGGKEEKIALYNNFSLNSESFLTNEPKVSVGDKVKKGDILADNNYTRDGVISLGANLNVAYMPYKGYNYEDSAVMSESAAKKLTSQHMYDIKDRRSASGVYSKSKLKAYYPEKLTKTNYDKLDKDGVIKVGQKVSKGDVVIAHMEKQKPTADDIVMGKLDRQLKRDMTDKSQTWENDHEGVVTDVKKHGNNVVVNIKTEEPFKEADKISGLHGNKHIISKILPDEEMPFNPKTGERIDLTMSPIGVSNRINTSQLIENAAGKLAAHTGKRYEIDNFSGKDNTQEVFDAMKAAGITHEDELINPETGKPFKNKIANGKSHILKLEHKVDHKLSARYREGYDSNQQAATGGHTGGKNMGRMESAALLARNANENLNEAFGIKSQRNDEFWRAFEMGVPTPPPQKSFAWDKFKTMMKGAGINIDQNGKEYTMKPMTNKDILELSSGEIKRPTETYRKKNLEPINEGLFDPKKAGGMQGENYTHFNLPEPVLNPVMAKAAASITGVTKTDLEKIIDGKKYYDKESGEIVTTPNKNSITGGVAVNEMLKNIDVDREITNSLQEIKDVKNESHLNKLNTKIRFLNGLKQSKLKPTDYMVDKVLVTPPKFRPIFAMGVDGTTIISDENDLYQQLAYTSKTLDDAKKTLDENIQDESVKNIVLKDIRGQVYKDLKALQGLGEPTSFLHRTKNKKGFLSQIDGGQKKQTKEGFFQDRVMERRQDLVGRSTIILNPTLEGDELGIPKEMANEIFRPFIMRKLVQNGYKPLEAKKEIENNTKAFQNARDIVSKERLVIANRAPTLHKWNMTSFKPKLTDGKSIEVPGVVVSKNFGGDFDGDSIYGNTYICIDTEEFNMANNVKFGKTFDGLTFEEIIQQAEVSVPIIDKLLIKKRDKLLHINIEDFPRIEDSKVVKDNGNEEYDVPNGVYIYTIENTGHKFIKNPVHKFSIHKNLINYHVQLNNGHNLWLSEDQSAIAIDNKLWQLKRVAPEELKSGLMIPQVIKTNIRGNKNKLYLKNKYGGSQCKDSVDLNKNIGWLLGAIIGDGWVPSVSDSTILSSIHTEIGVRFKKTISSLLLDHDSNVFKNSDSDTTRYIKYSKNIAHNIKKLIGTGASGKHLPPFYLNTSKKFREGLLSGLIDTDGSLSFVMESGRSKKKMMANYTTISERLAYEVSELCRSLGVKNTIGEITNREHEDSFYISINTEDLRKVKLGLSHPAKKEIWKEFKATEKSVATASVCKDLVPFSPDLYLKAHNIKKGQKLRKALYNSYYNCNCKYITRVVAEKLIKLDKKNILPKIWKNIVNNKNVTWLYAKKVKLNSKKINMYDITSPNEYTFMISNGVIVQDTFQIHTPVSDKALKEAWDYLPSKNMLKTGHGTTLNAPDMDMIAGTWLASKGVKGNKKPIKISNINELNDKIKNNEISMSDKVDINGKVANAIYHKVNNGIPDNMQKWDVELDKNTVNSWITEISKKKPNSNIGMKLADSLKEAGNKYISDFGLTLGIGDVLTNKVEREKIISDAIKKIDKKDKFSIIKNFAEAKKKGEDLLKTKFPKESNIGIPIHSGAGKGIGNTADITFMPGILTDAEDKPIPIPITKSYSEGLTPSEYWVASHGARGGNVKKSVQSFKPGWFTKDMINTVFETRIADDKEPVDTEGVEYDIDDEKAVFNRFLAQDAKNTRGETIAKANEVLNHDNINKLKKGGVKKVRVQSPLTDPTPGDGFSAFSYGLADNDKLMNRGDNVGIISAHTVTEPSLNLAMKAFHTGGKLEGDAKKKNIGSAFDVMDRVFRFTKNPPDKATISHDDGVVEDIKNNPVGGKDVYVRTKFGIESHYVKDMNEVKVRKGDKVKRGQFLSDGLPDPHEYLEYNGMDETRRYLTNKISELNNHKIDKRNIETIVRGLTNTTKIVDPGDSDFIKGDTAPYSTVKYMNEKEGKKIKHEPFLVPTGIQNKASVSEDWLARMTHSRLKDVFQDGTGMMWKSKPKRDSGNPMSYLVSKSE